jgi:hypothetical protein
VIDPQPQVVVRPTESNRAMDRATNKERRLIMNNLTEAARNYKFSRDRRNDCDLAHGFSANPLAALLGTREVSRAE